MKTSFKFLTLLFALGSLTTPMSANAVTYIFTDNTPTSAPQMNQNFIDVETAIAAKENTIASGTTLQFFRGDKTWATLNTSVVPEGANLYFLESRVRNSLLTGYTVGSPTSIAPTDTLIQALGKLEAQIAGSGLTSITAGNGLTGGTITTTGMIAVDVGTGPLQIVQLDGSGKLPAVDASQLVNLPSYTGFISSWSDITTITCSATNPVFPGEYMIPALAADYNSGSFNSATGIFTVPQNGVYEIFLDAPNDAYMSGNFRVLKNGSTEITLSAPSHHSVKRLVANDTLQLHVACYDMYNNGLPMNLNAGQFVFGIRKI